MNRIDQTFSRLRTDGRKALMPFITAGDPDLETTAELIRACQQAGAALIELGLPYSDPVADGPVIQESYNRSLARGTTLSAIFDMLKRLRRDCQIPISVMGSYSLVVRRGTQRFIDDAKAAGVDGMIIPDLPLEEAESLAAPAQAAGIHQVMLIAPTTPWERARQIAARGSGFVYYVSVSGITGERAALPPEIAERINQLRAATDLPICVGFGISRPEHVRMVTSAADGAIVGSAIVRRVQQHAGQGRKAIVQAVADYVAELAAAL
jgi:tryptophan synthase alpha chain